MFQVGSPRKAQKTPFSKRSRKVPKNLKGPFSLLKDIALTENMKKSKGTLWSQIVSRIRKVL